MLRKVAAVVAGLLVMGAVVMTLQWIGSLIHPLPPGVNPADPEDAAAFRAYLATMPVGVWILALGSELLGALLGGWVAARIAQDRRRLLAGVVVGLALAASVMNWLAFPHPWWFIGAQLVGYPLVALALVRLIPVNPYEAYEGEL